MIYLNAAYSFIFNKSLIKASKAREIYLKGLFRRVNFNKKIKEASKNGLMSIEIPLSLYSSHEVDCIVEELECGGYSLNWDKKDFIKVSWFSRSNNDL